MHLCRPSAATGGSGALDAVAAATEGYSGSDLMELASQVCAVEHAAAWCYGHGSSSRMLCWACGEVGDHSKAQAALTLLNLCLHASSG